jgi:hypothetical protein
MKILNKDDIPKHWIRAKVDASNPVRIRKCNGVERIPTHVNQLYFIADPETDIIIIGDVGEYPHNKDVIFCSINYENDTAYIRPSIDEIVVVPHGEDHMIQTPNGIVSTAGPDLIVIEFDGTLQVNSRKHECNTTLPT